MATELPDIRSAGIPAARPAPWRPAMGWLSQFAFDSRTVERIRERAPVLAPLIAVGLVNLAIALGMRGPLARGLAAQPPNVRQAIDAAFWLLAVFYPVIALAKALILGGVAWGVAALLNEYARFRALLSLLLYGELLLLLQGVFTALVLNLQGLDRVRQPSDLLVPWGFDMVAEPTSRAALAAAQSTTVFHVLWFAFLVFALPKVTAGSRGVAVATGVTLWAGIVAFSVLRAMVAA